MNRTDRLQAIITQLQSKKVVKAQEIANRFDISLRTVYRDIRALEEAGIPIGAEAGIGYFLQEDYYLPPIMFTTTEASALILAGKLMPFLSDNKVNQNYQDAIIKVRSVLKSTEKDELEKIDSCMNVLHYMHDDKKCESIFINDIQSALINQEVIRIRYFAKYNQTTAERDIEPISLLYYGMSWHLIAWCRLREEFRDFRLDRIESIKHTNKHYSRDLKSDFERYIVMVEKNMIFNKITIKVDNETANNIFDSKYWYGFVSEEKDNEYTIMRFNNPDLNGFASWILNMGTGVDIIENNDLRDALNKKLDKLFVKYRSGALLSP